MGVGGGSRGLEGPGDWDQGGVEDYQGSWRAEEVTERRLKDHSRQGLCSRVDVALFPGLWEGGGDTGLGTGESKTSTWPC